MVRERGAVRPGSPADGHDPRSRRPRRRPLAVSAGTSELACCCSCSWSRSSCSSDDRRSGRSFGCCRAPATCSCDGSCSGCTSPACTWPGSGGHPRSDRAGAAPSVPSLREPTRRDRRHRCGSRRRLPRTRLRRTRRVGLAGSRMDRGAGGRRRDRRRRRGRPGRNRESAWAGQVLRGDACQLGVVVRRRSGAGLRHAPEPGDRRRRFRQADVVALGTVRVPLHRYEPVALRPVRRAVPDPRRGGSRRSRRSGWPGAGATCSGRRRTRATSTSSTSFRRSPRTGRTWGCEGPTGSARISRAGANPGVAFEGIRRPTRR